MPSIAITATLLYNIAQYYHSFDLRDGGSHLNLYLHVPKLKS